MNRHFGLMVAMAMCGAYAPVGNHVDVIAEVPRRQRTAPIITRGGGESLNPLELHKLARKNARRKRRS